MQDLTQLESRILNAIRQTYAQQQQAPTLSEIGEAVGLKSKGTVRRYVLSLIDKGFLRRSAEKTWRNVTLTPEGEQALFSLPLLGRIAAGRPIEAIPGMEEINLLSLFQGTERYVLQVQGNSMEDAGILDGDWVILEKRAQANNGDIVAALIDNNEATLKRFQQNTADAIELIAENANIPAMVYEKSRVQIQGILVGQFRHYR